MANGKLDRCDVVVGSGDYVISAGSYKVTEGEAEVTRYKYGIQINLPTTFTPELTAKLLEVGKHRVMSVDAAGIFNKANDYGTKEEAEAFAAQFSTIEGWEKAFEKAKREGGKAKVTPLARKQRDQLKEILIVKVEQDAIKTAKTAVPFADNPPKTEKGNIKFAEWAEKIIAAGHPWADTALRQAQAAMKTDKYE